MLSHAKEHESLTGKLLLSTALVAVTVGYGWWSYGQAAVQQAAMMAAMQAQMQAASTAAMQAAPQTPVAQAAPAPDASTPAPTDAANSAVNNADAAPAPDNSKLAMAAPPSAAPATQAAAPQAATPAPAAAAAAAPTNGGLLPADPPKAIPPMPLTGMAAIQAFIPTEGISPPLPPVSGTPNEGANPPIPAGAHLVDGDYTSDRVQFEWGDLRSRIVITGGKVTTVQIMSYPDHRSQSLYLIQLADPILTVEVIKTQQAKVNTVSSATNSSIAFQDSIANAMMKATR